MMKKIRKAFKSNGNSPKTPNRKPKFKRHTICTVPSYKRNPTETEEICTLLAEIKAFVVEDFTKKCLSANYMATYDKLEDNLRLSIVTWKYNQDLQNDESKEKKNGFLSDTLKSIIDEWQRVSQIK